MEDLLNSRGLTVEGLLKLEPLIGSELVAGKASATNVINRVNIVGSPEVLNFVRPNEFIMTTGYPFRDSIEDFASLIPQLHEKGVAGIGIKIQRFIPSIPQNLIDIANELNFPVVAVPPATVFSDIIRVAMEEIFFQESEHLITLYNRIQEFTRQLTDGKEIKEVIYSLEQMIGNPIVVFDSEGNSIAPLLSDVLSEVEILKLSQTIEKKAGAGLSTVSIRNENFQCFATPLTADGIFDHIPFIACLETNYKLTDVDCLTIEKVSIMLNMELANTNARKKIEQKYYNQFVKHLLLGEITSISDVETQNSSLDIDFKKKWFQVFILNTEQVGGVKEEFYYYLRTLSKVVKGQLLGSILHDQFVFVMIVDVKSDLQQNTSFIKQETERFFQYKKLVEDFVLCVGESVQHVEEIPLSYKRAEKVKVVQQHFSFTKRLVTYDDLQIFRLLYLLPGSEDVVRYVDDILGGLDNEKKRSKDYIETLEVYFKSNRNMRETAKKLFTHYNTVVYRMEKIAALLKIDLEDSEAVLELEIALKIRRLRQYQNKKEKNQMWKTQKSFEINI
ncbi:transcriptional regulator, PucR family [Evansella cellulosilytica DSM 2522]|uniref:Transcriptional regulator, PucR family n=1 Tax=Evansella cellulosilytica (strain ATCC 21833 / DSM 2522 / FERM P-1141 / JCM 9156 / N-4) TaxID=649639 RepID=E6TRY1_EVAC2|nr:PucR family transcriptional regulator [Evansella cellulosilytica]ADU29504.1 transcriptional regulator, PucR family [Evansella cellulosilytica DSM 2522]